MKSLKSWDTAIIGMGRGFKVPNAPCARAWEAVGVKKIHLPLEDISNDGQMQACLQPCVQHSPERSINWPWSGAMINKVRAWETKIQRLTFRRRMKPDETWVGYRTRTAKFQRKS